MYAFSSDALFGPGVLDFLPLTGTFVGPSRAFCSAAAGSLSPISSADILAIYVPRHLETHSLLLSSHVEVNASLSDTGDATLIHDPTLYQGSLCTPGSIKDGVIEFRSFPMNPYYIKSPYVSHELAGDRLHAFHLTQGFDNTILGANPKGQSRYKFK